MKHPNTDKSLGVTQGPVQMCIAHIDQEPTNEGITRGGKERQAAVTAWDSPCEARMQEPVPTGTGKGRHLALPDS